MENSSALLSQGAAPKDYIVSIIQKKDKKLDSKSKLCILKLRRQGKSFEEIGQELRLSADDVRDFIEEYSKRDQIIIKMTQEHKTLQEIGDKLGITRERVRQIKKKIEKRQGTDVFKLTKSICSVVEAAEALNTYEGLIYRLCRQGLVPCQGHKTKKGKFKYLLDNESLDVIRDYLKRYKKGRCVVCGRYFKIETKQRRRITCSEKCREMYKRQRMIRLERIEPNEKNLQRWHKNLWQKLENHALWKNERWVDRKKAVKYTKLSAMQIDWLRHRHVLKTRPHPTKKWHGRPVRQYAVSQLRIVARIWQSEQVKQG